MSKIDATVLNPLADELLEEAVLRFDQEAVVFIEDDRGDVVVAEKYERFRDWIYDTLDDHLNGAE